MAKKRRHPAEVWTEEQMIIAIRSADHFMASLFVGTGNYEKVTGKTVKAAMVAGDELAAERRTSRRPILYAIGPRGHATMLTMSLIERLAKAALSRGMR